MVVVLQHHRGDRDLRLLIGRAGATALALLLACEPPAPPTAHQAPITNAADDDGDLGVAALLHGGTLVCTATLVTPRVLLTAAHCLPGGEIGRASCRERVWISVVAARVKTQNDVRCEHGALG